MASGDWIDQVSQLFSNPRGLWEDITGTGLQREQFEYQKQLQQQIFEREDTAWQRATKDAQKVGINPMALTSGANAGSVVPTSMDTSGNIQGINAMINALGIASQVSQAINEAKTGNIQRDLLAQEQFRNRLENVVYAYENGLRVDENGNIHVTPDSPLLRREIQQSEKDSRETSTKGQKITNERNERVNEFQEKTGTNDLTTTPFRTAADIQNFGSKNKSLLDNIREWYTDSKNKNAYDYFENDSYTDALEGLLSKYSNIIKNKAKNVKSGFSNWRNKNKQRLNKYFNK